MPCSSEWSQRGLADLIDLVWAKYKQRSDSGKVVLRATKRAES